MLHDHSKPPLFSFSSLLLSILFFGFITLTSICCDKEEDDDKEKYSEFQINAKWKNFQINPTLEMEKDGNFVVVWSTKTTGDYDIAARVFNSSGTALSDEIMVNTYLDNQQKDSDVAINNSGDFVVVWESWYQENQNFEVYGRSYNALGQAQGDVFRINQYTSSYQRDAAVAMDDEGNFAAVWLSYGQGGVGNMVYARLYDSNGVAKGGEFLVSNLAVDDIESPSLEDAPDLESESEPEQLDIGMDSIGNFVVVWTVQGEFDQDIYARLFDPSGTPIGNEFLVNNNRSGDQTEISVSMAGNGNFVVAWMGPGDGDDTGTYARRFDSNGTALGDEFQVNTYTSADQGYPSVALADNGAFVVAYESRDQDGDETGIFARKYNSIGEAESAEFQVNTYTKSWQEELGAAISEKTFAIVWMSTELDGDLDGIFCRVFQR